MGEIKDEMVTKVMMEVKVQMASSKKLGNHNGRCSVVSEGNKSTGKMNECSQHSGQRQLYENMQSRRNRSTTEIRCH